MEDLIGKISSGDTEGVAKMVAERGINVARNQIAMKIEAQSSWGVYRSSPSADSKRGLTGLSLPKSFEEIS